MDADAWSTIMAEMFYGSGLLIFGSLKEKKKPAKRLG